MRLQQGKEMLSSLLGVLYRRLGVRSLGAKVFVPGLALVLLSVLAGTALFLVGSRLMRQRLMEQQISAEADEVIEAMDQRAGAVSSAGQLLANDPSVADALRERTDTARLVLLERAEAVGDDFDLAVAQFYDQQGVLQAEIVRSSLCLDGSTTGSLLNLAEPGTLVARAVGDHVLLLYRIPVLEGAGTTVVCIDLERELERIRNTCRLSTDLGVALRGTQAGTLVELPFDAERGWIGDQCCEKRSIRLGDTPAELVLVRSGGGVGSVTRGTLVVVIGSTVAASLMLGGLNITMVRSMERRLGTLSAAIQAVSQGDLGRTIHLKPDALTIGDGDALALLMDSLNEMISSFRAFSSDLEAQVEAHRACLAIAAGVPQAGASGLEPDAILSRSVRLILRHLGRSCPGIYHVAVYLAGRGSDAVVLREVATEASKAPGRGSVQVPVGSTSPVGLAVATKQVEVVQDVRLVSAHLKPPLLMDTYSAAAVPLLVGDVLIGVLDVQSKQPQAFPSATLQLLNTLANQIATAVHNAQVYQQQCLTAERLAEVDRRKTQFLAFISHKLRAPLSTIRGLSRGMVEDGTSPLTDEQARALSLIRSLGQHLLEFTDDFLGFSKLRAGAITLNLEDVDIRLLIESSLDAVAPLIEDRPITLRADVAPDLPVVRADKRRIRQVLLNLLSNAVAFTEAGRISVQARGIDAPNIDTGLVEPFVEVRIGDTGLVMSKGEAAAGLLTFDGPDRIGVSAPGSECTAVGFALRTTEALIERHGGRIWVDATGGVDVTFAFILPVEQLNVGRQGSREGAALGSPDSADHEPVG